MLGKLSRALLDRFKESLAYTAGPSITTLTSETVWPNVREGRQPLILSHTENTLSAGASLNEVGPAERSFIIEGYTIGDRQRNISHNYEGAGV